MAQFIGSLASITISGTVFIYLSAALIEFLIFKRVADSPVTGKVSSAVGGYVIIAVLVSSAEKDFNADLIMRLVPSFLIVLYLSYRRGREIAREMAEETGRSYY